MAKRYSADFLIDVANSATIPELGSDAWPWHMFQAKDGWQVVVFYDVGELDYIDHFVDPNGEIVNFWEWEDSSDRDKLQIRPGDEPTLSMRMRDSPIQE